MELTIRRYQIGQRLQHPQFGEGLVVEVHDARGREVLEVVFDGQLRRLSAIRDWAIVEPNAPGPATRSTDAPSRTWHAQGDQLLEQWQVAPPSSEYMKPTPRSCFRGPFSGLCSFPDPIATTNRRRTGQRDALAV